MTPEQRDNEIQILINTLNQEPNLNQKMLQAVIECRSRATAWEELRIWVKDNDRILITGDPPLFYVRDVLKQMEFLVPSEPQTPLEKLREWALNEQNYHLIKPDYVSVPELLEEIERIRKAEEK